ncbi:MAG: hypothetical protein NZL92_12175, partial [Gloeomargarita sp. SKYG116]|nr:hypothetical protein [Gloeomargarita sp. SKYG116]MDW8402436.1 hypothetical protein [Gloeomargarita sp. SKYGB_i_bin116]
GFREYLPGQWLGIPTVESNTGSGQDSFTGIMRANNQRLAYRFRTVKTHVGDPYGSVLPVDLGSSTLNPAVNLPCDVSLADIDYFGYSRLKSPISLADATNPDIQRIEREMVALARLCPTQPKYPSLYYLFP